MLMLIAVAAMLVSEPGSRPLSDYRTLTIGTFTVLARPDAEADAMRYRRVLAALAFDIDTINRVVPADALTALHSVKIVITPQTDGRAGFTGRGMCYHESAGWLTANGYDAEREGTVEILNMDDFLLWRAEQPMMLLHEMAHAYHAKLGMEREDVKAAFTAAKEAKSYEAVRHVLAAPGEKRRAYAITNPREYFAELTEAWFGRNDYFPFTREELVAHDAGGAEVVARLWGLTASEIEGGK